ncbi:MAG: AAA family ATPase [Gallionella sp.]|nr:AAA family ATPase [Gallionella sp.]
MSNQNKTTEQPTLPATLDDFEAWLAERHKWLQTAAARLLSAGIPSDDEISALADLCIAESTKNPKAKFESIPIGAFSQSTPGKPLRIEKLNKVCGVNAIKDNASLDFGSSNISVIYGTNGAGKSGFARLLKHACGARHKSDLHPNVFADKPSLPSAEFVISKDGQQLPLPWSLGQGPLSELRHVHIFDTFTANGYVNGKNECTYEPRKLRFISALISVCDRVSQKLSEKAHALVKALPAMPTEFAGTEGMVFYSKLSKSTTESAISSACILSDDETKDRLTLETTLKQTDVQQRLKELAEEQKRVVQLRQEMDSLFSGLSDTKLTAVIAARLDAEAKRKAANEDAAKVFSGAPLNGVGQESWRLLWGQARAYSESLAYPQQAFPIVGDDAKCVLCQQSLDSDAKARLLSFENFVIQGLEASAREAEQLLAKILSNLPRIPSQEDWNLKAGLLKLDDKMRDQLFGELHSRHKAFNEARDMSNVASLNVTLVNTALKTWDEKLAQETKGLQELQTAGKRDELEKRLKALRAKEWLSQQQVAIRAEIARLVEVAKLESAVAMAATRTLTAKKNDLALVELSSGYKTRFEEELKKLGGIRIPVEPVPQKEGKGKITFELQLKDSKRKTPTNVILSEGENRIVALAAFLADMTAVELPTPFVFDDPISSLDQDFEERVVDRLVELASSRQVIVFTHRLSLVTLLEEAVAHLKNNAEAAKISPKVSININAIRSMGALKGLSTNAGMQGKAKKGLAIIQNNEIGPLRRLFNEGNADFDGKAKQLCSEFRILIEHTVEQVLLGEVVKRFRRSVQTMGRISALAKITPKDCEFIDGLMTKYSCFEHSQPIDITVNLPTPDELEADVKSVTDWIAEFEKRPVT